MELPLIEAVSRDLGVGKTNTSLLGMVCLLGKYGLIWAWISEESWAEDIDLLP